MVEPNGKEFIDKINNFNTNHLEYWKMNLLEEFPNLTYIGSDVGSETIKYLGTWVAHVVSKNLKKRE
jgi:hypothetical protein